MLGFNKQVRQSWWMNYKHLSMEERYAIAAMRGQRVPMAQIAGTLGRHRSTMYREVRRNCSAHDGFYRATHSVQKASARKRRSRRNLRYGTAQMAGIEERLRLDWSPEQIVGSLRRQGQEVMSHETIYRHIWRDKAAGGTLWCHLRGARKQRRKRYGAYDSRGRLAGKRMIEQRPAIVNRRRRIGDWEIDTVHGRGKACLVTIVERRSGRVRLGPIPRATMEHTLQKTVELLQAEPHPVRTITADNGTEFHNYQELEHTLDTMVYFATPHHAWERGSNENCNGLIRQYFPKRTNLSRVTQEQCNQIAQRLNDRPRLRHGFKTPDDIYFKPSNVALQM
jgi:IS30 family transposase